MAEQTTRDRLENDRAALAVALRLAEYAAKVSAELAERERQGIEPANGYEETEQDERRALADLYENGAGGIEPDAVIAWLKGELAAVDNSIDALDGAGPPDPDSPAVALLREAVEAWPAFDGDDDVSGGDLVEWFGEWRARAVVALERAALPATPEEQRAAEAEATARDPEGDAEVAGRTFYDVQVTYSLRLTPEEVAHAGQRHDEERGWSGLDPETMEEAAAILARDMIAEEEHNCNPEATVEVVKYLPLPGGAE